MCVQYMCTRNMDFLSQCIYYGSISAWPLFGEVLHHLKIIWRLKFGFLHSKMGSMLESVFDQFEIISQKTINGYLMFTVFKVLLQIETIHCCFL